jgi:hypothetical protein
MDRHPGLAVELFIADTIGGLTEERLDVALIGWQPPETMTIVRAVGTYGRIAVASPGELEPRGAPTHPAALARHPAAERPSYRSKRTRQRNDGLSCNHSDSGADENTLDGVA